MPRPANPTRLLFLLAAVAALGLTAAGCGTSKADEERGRALFVESCGTCHALAQAGTTAQIGPDLDRSFAAARASGQTDSTIRGVVKAQVEHPRPSTGNSAVSMPADIVTGQDLEDVAAYVGDYAGVPGAAPPRVAGGLGAQVFADNGCGGCHTLGAAGSSGTTGPDLDEALPGQGAAAIRKSILDPNAEIAPGYPANVMPANYGTLIDRDELEELVDFLISSTGNGGG